ncbi:hypothetical protein DACRYDRAFT_83901 [Dacryopinax primogenitus]|uniref:ER membrane protein complex subunit 2 n=1 Tax=Dacryopinax primogenitus (strain DJM 731) TaxID=1858805 RepID=M5FRA6_DACPD|nr:uncharacterized protein DACRYDRAFT_83901 [Dacryopinax primogenitus]EJT98158.1 hypothetical protein DACRYDRAFT_83901 [Dacryopinax primogenitus]
MAIFSLAASATPSDTTRPHRSSREFHLSRTVDILHLSLQRGDIPRAQRAWAILVRCKEFDWRAQWRIGLAVLQGGEQRRIDYLQKAFLACPDEKESILKELVLSYISQSRERAALDQLELYLHAFPFQDNPALHAYAGMLCLYLAQAGETTLGADHNLLREARQHFATTMTLDPKNEAAQTYRQMVRDIAQVGREEWRFDLSEGEESAV